MFIITPTLKDILISHSVTTAPQEMCGLILDVKGRDYFYGCRNVHPNPCQHFIIHPQDYQAGLAKGRLIAIAHSHLDGSGFSEMDVHGQRVSGVPWVLVVLSPGRGVFQSLLIMQ